ncbi:hypothetical protein F4820DRAFT_445019 [Hypoxylon rubiginosum]|uniref:Uncharacterized protein n=1 Tax=Hypoxylon rubiginosum TaxID=110542 RepID=A0ACB9ZAM5_9PEZI|nr:hypothetical protein F4820DRAFT_445019 [Hypoxylon rubiginosum]
MANTVGDGLYRVDIALAALITNPQQLDRARERFSKSPSYESHLSHNSTRSQSSEPPSEEQRRREEQKRQLIREHRASFPFNQFAAQCREEEQRIIRASENATLLDEMRLVDPKVRRLARETIEKRWVEQGIWSDKWKDAGVWRWKHEEPLVLEPDLESDLEAEDTTHPLSSSQKARTSKPRITSERRAILEREREQSRPYYQFIYQVSKERERKQNELPIGSDSPDINTRAYENVKNTWVKRRIWNRKWGMLPGMTWVHEQPLDQMLAEEMGVDTPSPVNPPDGLSWVIR